MLAPSNQMQPAIQISPLLLPLASCSLLLPPENCSQSGQDLGIESMELKFLFPLPSLIFCDDGMTANSSLYPFSRNPLFSLTCVTNSLLAAMIANGISRWNQQKSDHLASNQLMVTYCSLSSKSGNIQSLSCSLAEPFWLRCSEICCCSHLLSYACAVTAGVNQ